MTEHQYGNTRQKAYPEGISMEFFFLFAHLQTIGWEICDGFMADDIYLFETAHKVVTDW